MRYFVLYFKQEYFDLFPKQLRFEAETIAAAKDALKQLPSGGFEVCEILQVERWQVEMVNQKPIILSSVTAKIKQSFKVKTIEEVVRILRAIYCKIVRVELCKRDGKDIVNYYGYRSSKDSGVMWANDELTDFYKNLK